MPYLLASLENRVDTAFQGCRSSHFFRRIYRKSRKGRKKGEKERGERKGRKKGEKERGERKGRKKGEKERGRYPLFML